MFNKVIAATIMVALPVVLYFYHQAEQKKQLAHLQFLYTASADIKNLLGLYYREVEFPETVTDKHEPPPSPPHSLGGGPLIPDFTGDALWLRYEHTERWHVDNYDLMLVWNASTGKVERYNFPNIEQTLRYDQDFLPSVIAIPAGLFLQGGRHYIFEDRQTDHARIVLLTRNSEVVVGRLNTAREKPHLLLLADGSLLVVSGITSGSGTLQATWTNAVEHVSYLGGKLVVEPMADLPGEIRHGVSLVQLADGSVLAAGGSLSNRRGVEPMVDTTYILDMANNTWHQGPPLAEPRADAAAILLPDGSVMMAGGWTRAHTWKDGASRTSDLLLPGSNTFVSGPLLPLGIASPTTAWIKDASNNMHLFMVGGVIRESETSHEVHEYDLRNGEWRTVADVCLTTNPNVYPTYSLPNIVIFSAANERDLYLWCYNYDSQGGTEGWRFSTPRLLDATAESPGRNIPHAGLNLRREAAALIASQGDSPALVVGGYIGSVPTASVDAISPDGKVEALANLNIPRGDAQLFRLQDGSFIVSGGRSKRYGVPSTNSIRSMEWLPAGEPLAKEHWRLLDSSLPDDAIIFQLNNGRLLTLESGNIVKLITFTPSTEGPVMITSAMPPLTRKRQQIGGPESLKIKELSDGRIIVAGGAVQQDPIPRVHEDSHDPEADDEENFEDMTPYVEARTYEIYEPGTGAWSESAPSQLDNGESAILDDGRVIKLGALGSKRSSTDDASHKPVDFIEASSSDGSAWQEWPVKPDITLEHARLFVTEGELFISGKNPNLSSFYGPSLVQWYNPSQKQWITVWEDTGSSHLLKNVGLFIVRQLANGKRVVLSVQPAHWY